MEKLRLLNWFPFTLCALLLMGLSSSTIEQDSLHKREFRISMSETKNGIVAKKTINDKFSFKNGKMYSEFLHKKFGYSWIRYRINKDSVYTDSTDTEVRLLVVEASDTDEKNQTVLLDFTTCEWDIDGVLKITKNDRLKRHYDFAGREIGGKPKKQKKTNEKKSVLEIVY